MKDGDGEGVQLSSSLSASTPSIHSNPSRLRPAATPFVPFSTAARGLSGSARLLPCLDHRMTSRLSPKDEAFTRLMCFASSVSSNEYPK